jgi:DNA-binding response OmpR family regulator
MRFVLDRHGFEVTTASRGDLLEQLDRRRADAVILDAPESLLEAGQAAAAAKARHPEVEIVVVSERDSGNGETSFAVYDKWDGMDDVVETVSRAVAASHAA